MIRGTRLSPAAPLVGHLVEVLAPTPQDINKGICARTPEVRDALVAAARTRYTWVKDCTEMTSEHLAEMERLYLTAMNISAAKPGDFDDLTNLIYLQLAFNSINHLPEGLFSDLAKLTTLELSHNSLTDVDLLKDKLLEEIPSLIGGGLDLRYQE